MSLKTYPGYKDSGYPWLGEIPSSWPVRPSKTVFGLRNEPERGSDVHLTPSQSLGVLPQADYMKITGNKVVLALAGTTMKHVEVNDFVIHLRSFQGGIEWSGFAGKVSPAYTVLYPKIGADPAYFRYLLKSRGYVEAIASLTEQLRDGQSMRYYDFGKTPLPLPSFPEQQAIARYLDWETAEIDTFIADQEELIRLLEERRAATITQAVTRGLDPSVQKKESGVEWLGEIPEHWELMALKRHLIGIDQGVSPEASGELADEFSVGVLKAGCVNGGVFVDTQHKRLADGFIYDSRIAVSEGDLLVNRASGSLNLVGSAAVVRQLRYRLILSDKTFRLRIKESSSAAYLEKYLNSTLYRQQVRTAISGAEGLANNLPSGALRRFLVPTPPIAEQLAVVEYLDRETSEIDAAIVDAKESIELSKERRSALISAAVTGKIDVRDHVFAEGAA